MKSLGRIAYEEYTKEMFNTRIEWPFIEQGTKDAWETAAAAVVEEYEQRRPDPDDEDDKLI